MRLRQAREELGARQPCSLRERLRAIYPTSIGWRLATWVAGVLLAAAAVTFVVVYSGTGQQLRDQIERDLRNDTGQLSQSLQLLAGAPPAQIAAAARRYVAAQPYRSTSTLLFV